LFVSALKIANEKLAFPYSKPQLFSFYEEFISYPIDDLKDNVDDNRLGFYELISLMSWALYRVWVQKVVDEKQGLNCFCAISINEVVKLFLDNLSCDEGTPLFKKLTGVRV